MKLQKLVHYLEILYQFRRFPTDKILNYSFRRFTLYLSDKSRYCSYHDSRKTS